MSPPSSIPQALEVNSPLPWYKRPLFFGSLVVSAMVGVSLWSYIAHPAWLGESNSSNELINSILRVNPGLSRADLEQDIQTENLSFWFGRSGRGYGGVQTVSPGTAVTTAEGSLLEQFMRGQEASNQKADKGSAQGTNKASENSTPTASLPALAETLEAGATSPSATIRETRSALDIAINGIDEANTDALSPLQRALQNYQATVTAETSEAKAVGGNTATEAFSDDAAASLNDTDGATGAGVAGNGLYNRNTGLPPAAAADTGSPTRTSRTADPTATPDPLEVLTQRSRRRTASPDFDSNAYRNTASPTPNTANSNSTVNRGQRQQFEHNFTDQGSFNRIGNGEVESFGNPLGTN